MPRDDDVATLTLPTFLKGSLSEGHPWVYRDHVPRSFRAASGTWVRIEAGGFSAYALWDEKSPIALRVFSRQRVPDADWMLDRVTDAWELRGPLRARGTTAYRWIAGEGDGLPGVVVDLYGKYAVVATYADALESLVPRVVDALGRSAELEGVVRREGDELRVLAGREPPRELWIVENGLSFRADLRAGQKTGLFLDQRENRATVEKLSAERRVLNLFAYTGGFSAYALRGGAARVTTVDVAAAAAEEARATVEHNGLDASLHEVVVDDAFEYLKRAKRERRKWDLVVCDPPSFARQKAQKDDAMNAYARLHALGLEVTRPGGLYAASSCTAQVDPTAFREVLVLAARRASRRFQIVHEAGQPLDHPVFADHPEGRYLKFVVGRAQPLA